MSEKPITFADKLFTVQCDFIAGSDKVSALPPPTLPEIAFAGRSNVGKSSLINAITGRRALARVSHTPGRTQQLNFFDLGGGLLRMVDMPGYGYAKVSKAQVLSWKSLIRDYLRGRVVLRRVCVLVDSRHGVKDVDLEIFDLLDEAAVPYQIVLTKVDEIRREDCAARIEEIGKLLKKHPAAMPQIMATSSEKGVGISELRAELATLAVGQTPPLG